MENEMDDDVREAIGFLESRGLKELFRDLSSRSKGRNWVFASPRSLDEKSDLDALINAGLISIEDSEFRVNLQGYVKASEFICKITNLGELVAAAED